MFVELTKKFYWDYWSRSWLTKQITSIYVVTFLLVAVGYVKAFKMFMDEWTSPQSENELLAITFFIVGVPILSDWIVFQYEKISRMKLKQELKDWKEDNRDKFE